MYKNRQKSMKLVNSSQLVWKIVQEYEANPKADNLEVEKMYRAHRLKLKRGFPTRENERDSNLIRGNL